MCVANSWTLTSTKNIYFSPINPFYSQLYLFVVSLWYGKVESWRIISYDGLEAGFCILNHFLKWNFCWQLWFLFSFLFISTSSNTPVIRNLLIPASENLAQFLEFSDKMKFEFFMPSYSNAVTGRPHEIYSVQISDDARTTFVWLKYLFLYHITCKMSINFITPN